MLAVNVHKAMTVRSVSRTWMGVLTNPAMEVRCFWVMSKVEAVSSSKSPIF